MSKRARIYVGSILLLGAALAVRAFFPFDPLPQPWLAFTCLTILAAFFQLFKSEAPNHQLYHPSLVFTFAGMLLLPPALFVLMVLIYHLIEWAQERLLKSSRLLSWYVQPFNISMHILTGLLARLVFQWINPAPLALSTLSAVVAAFAAGLVYVSLNHTLVGLFLKLVRSVPIRESRVLAFENTSTDFVMLMMGYTAAILMQLDLLLILPVLTPLYLIHRALMVPALKQQANTDAKTGLWNALYFVLALESELSRAQRFNRPMTVVMGDLDLLRNINNAYGHLAGDVVLSGVARILKERFREYDVVARFGGEEFAILMPETYPEDAFCRLEAIRAAVEASEFEAPTSHARIKVTISFGIAGLHALNQTAKEIIHQADVAVYEAKMRGRNQSCIFSLENAMAYRLLSDVGAPEDQSITRMRRLHRCRPRPRMSCAWRAFSNSKRRSARSRLPSSIRIKRSGWDRKRPDRASPKLSFRS